MPTAHAAQRAASPAVEHKSFAAPILETPDDEPGTIRAIVAVFNNIDAGNDRIRPGFFAKSIARKLPKGVWGHDWETPIAKTLEAKELHPGDPLLPPSLMELGGLYIKGLFNLNTQRGRDAYEDVKFGLIDEFSIGYRANESEVDKKTGVRDLIEGDIFEWSTVLVGMNDRTRLLSVKAADRAAPETTKSAKAENVSAKADPVPGKTFLERSREMVAVIGEFEKRAEDRITFRIERGRKKALPDAEQKVGRVLSRQTEDELTSVADAAESLARTVRALLARANPTPADEPAETGGTKADANATGAPPADAAREPAAGAATPAVTHVPAPVDQAPPAPDAGSAAGAAPAFDEADILATYARTQYALTMAAVGSLTNHG